MNFLLEFKINVTGLYLIKKSNFIRINFDPTSSHIRKAKDFSKKWVRKGEL